MSKLNPVAVNFDNGICQFCFEKCEKLSMCVGRRRGNIVSVSYGHLECLLEKEGDGKDWEPVSR